MSEAKSLDTVTVRRSSRPYALPAPSRHPECGSHSGLRWYCGQAKAGQVQAARDNLIRQEFEVLVPLVARQVGGDVRISPLLGSYFLVRFDRARPGWRRIVSTRGVVRLFGTSPELPSPLRDADVDHLRAIRCDDAFDPKPVGSGLKTGVPIRCIEGPCSGATGICLEVVSATVRCLLFSASGPVDVEQPMRWVRRA